MCAMSLNFSIIIKGFVLISVNLWFAHHQNKWSRLMRRFRGLVYAYIHFSFAFLFTFNSYSTFAPNSMAITEMRATLLSFIFFWKIYINAFVGCMVNGYGLFTHFFYFSLACIASKSLPIYRCHFMQKSTRNDSGFESTIIKM